MEDPTDALGTIRGYAAVGRIEYSPHARKEMLEAGAAFADVRAALTKAKSATLQPNGRWRVAGPDQDGEELTVIVAIEAGLQVVTVF